MMSYQDARKLKRMFRDTTRPSIRRSLAGNRHKNKEILDAIAECECPIRLAELKRVKKQNNRVAKTLSNIHNKNQEEAWKYFLQMKANNLQLIKDATSQHKRDGLEGAAPLSNLKLTIKSVDELMTIMEAVGEADIIFKHHKERKHKKLARANKKGNKRK